jgi:hypothetical protein
MLSVLLGMPVNQTSREVVQKSYLELLELEDIPRLAPNEVKAIEDEYKREKRAEDTRLKKAEDRIKQDLKAARKRLEGLDEKSSRDNPEAARQRAEIHCEVQRLESELSKTKTQREKGLPVLYQNKFAKLELIQKWPAIRARIAREIDEGTARKRKYGNIEDIGVRDLGIENLGEKQQGDVRTGQDAIHDMRGERLMPPEHDDKEVTEYIRKLAESIARNSDLRVPIKVTVLDSMEINAFALPGGFLFVNTGLINKAETEAELAGVLAHEIAHAAARHGPRLMKKARIMDLIFQAAQVGAIVLTGGAASYALQYGFFGVGMVLDLSLLGVSRDFEVEADQLGAQYAWQAGYDPKGFITFFDKMASEEGYVKSTSFFRTHPPFLERILSTFSEITYLPAGKALRLDSSAFENVKKRIAQLTRQREMEVEERPTLRDPPLCRQPR